MKNERNNEELSPTGKIFVDLVDKYREMHPDQDGVPLEEQEVFWEAAAVTSGNQQFLENLRKARRV